MLDALCFLKYTDHFLHVMAVHRSQIRDPHVLKQHSGNEELFDPVLQLVQTICQRSSDHRNRGECPFHPEF